jgi:hypothetical protein
MPASQSIDQLKRPSVEITPLIRVRNQREIGGLAQTDRAECDAGGDPE